MTATPWLAALAPGVELYDDGRARPGYVTARETVAQIPGWIDELEGRVGRREVASSFSGMWVAGPVVALVTGAYLLGQRAYTMTPDSVLLRRGEGGWVDGIVVGPLFVESEDPALAAQGLVDTVAPLLEAHARAGRFGLRGLWGNSVADRVLETATQLVRSGHAPLGAIGDAERLLLAAVAALAPVRLPRPGTQTVLYRDTPQPFALKSCCCLMYLTLPADRGTQRPPEAYCTSCPLIADAGRAPRWLAHLDSQPTP